MALNADQRTGTYNGKISYTIPQAAAQLDREGLSWSSGLGQAATVTYAYRASAPVTMPEDASGFSQFSNLQINATERALAAWSAIAGITFVRVGSGQDGSSAYSNDATILFGNYTSGEDGASAFAILPGSTASSSATGDVWINVTLGENSELAPGQYGYTTLLHEIGHAIGLSHPSNYDVMDDGGSTLTYRHDASYYEDSLQYTVMSYFSASSTGSDVEDHTENPATPLIDDIAAAQRLYGINPQGNAGDTRYSTPWGAIFDTSGNDTLDYRYAWDNQAIDLRGGNFSDVMGGHGNLAIAVGTTIENAVGGNADDTIIGNDAGNSLNGWSGNDVLRGGLGNDTYVGGPGTDRAVVGGNVWDYRLIDGGTVGLILESRNGSGDSWIDGSIETIQFQNGQYLSPVDVQAYVQTDTLGGYRPLLAYPQSWVKVSGGPGLDRVFVDGNVGNYTLSRPPGQTTTGEWGDFVLTGSDGSIVAIGEAVEQVQFRNGQYLSLKDLGAYVAGSSALSIGGAQDDLLIQTKAGGFQSYAGGVGNDTVYLSGNVSDYTMANFTGASVPDGTLLSGVALIARNGSGIQFIDASVETVQFRNGQYLSFHDIPAYIEPSGSSLSGVRVIADGLNTNDRFIPTVSASDTLYLDGNVGDYVVNRGTLNGDFVFQHGSTKIDFGRELSSVHFQNGQSLSVADLPAYTQTGSYTDGSSQDDLLWAASGGDQLLLGHEGVDNAYLHGNVTDYSLAQFTRMDPIYSSSGTYIIGFTEVDGYELVARNGSGKIDIDPTTEIVHFQNGQYLAYGDLSAYIQA